MARINIIKVSDKVVYSTFLTKKCNGYTHVGVNAPHWDRPETFSKINHILK